MEGHVLSLFAVRVVRSHFKHSIELVDESGEITDHLAGVEDFMLAKATFDALPPYRTASDYFPTSTSQCRLAAVLRLAAFLSQSQTTVLHR